MKVKLLAAAGGLVLATAMWAVPALAADGGWVCDGWGGCASSYNNWQGVMEKDEDCDGQGVYAMYKRDSGSTQRLDNYSGCGNTEYTGTSTNLVSWYYSCTNVPNWWDECSDTVTRP